MARSLAKHQVGDASKTERSGPQGIVNFLQGVDTSGTTLWVSDLGTFGGNGKEGRGETHRFSLEDYRETGVAITRQDTGHVLIRISARIGKNTVGNDLHSNIAGNRRTVGSVASNIRSVHRREGL